MNVYKYNGIDMAMLSPDLHAAIAYWNSIKGQRIGPKWSEFDLMKLPLRLLSYTHVVDLVDGGKDFLFRFYGTSFVEIYGTELTGKKASEIEPALLSNAVLESFSEIVETRNAVASVNEVNPGILTTLQILVRLPLSEDGETVSHIATVAEYKQNVADSRNVMDNLFKTTP